MKWLLPLIPLLIGLCSRSTCAQARQQTDKLESERAQNQKKIAESDRILKETQDNRLNSVTKLRDLGQKIAQHSSFVAIMDEEVKFLDREIADNKSLIDALDSDLAALRKEYGELLYEQSKARNVLAKLSYLFAAESFNQAAARLRYLNQLVKLRHDQLLQIKRVAAALRSRRQRLADNRARKENLLEIQRTEAVSIAGMKKAQSEMVAKLQQREGAIRKDLANRQRIDREIAAQLTELQLRPKWEDDFNPSEDNSANGAKVNKPSRLSPKISPESQKVITVKPVENASVEGPVNNRIGAVVDPPRAQPFVGLGGRMVISNTPKPEKSNFSAFSAGKANLPWPVNEGVITGKFGKHEHPVFEKVMTENLGVDIRTNRNEPARAIFAGKIVSISQMSGLGYVVMIRHGEFVTVYTRLKSVSVAKGATVGMKDQIGIVGLNDEGFPELQFQIWRNQTRLNPEEWLAKY